MPKWLIWGKEEEEVNEELKTIILLKSTCLGNTHTHTHTKLAGDTFCSALRETKEVQGDELVGQGGNIRVDGTDN